jgi:CBS domain-containing protein
MKARDIMTREVTAVTADETIAKVAGVMRTLDVGMLPVIDTPRTRKLIGVITDRDIVVRCLAEGHTGLCDVQLHMTTGPLATVQPEATAQEIVTRMAGQQVRRLPVVDADGRLMGIVTQADIAREVGPTEPQLVERMMEGISQPGALVR